MSQSIWFVQPDLALINSYMRNTIDSTLGIKITELGDDFIRGTMPVDHRTFQLLGAYMVVPMLCWLSRWAVRGLIWSLIKKSFLQWAKKLMPII